MTGTEEEVRVDEDIIEDIRGDLSVIGSSAALTEQSCNDYHRCLRTGKDMNSGKCSSCICTIDCPADADLTARRTAQVLPVCCTKRSLQ